MYTCHHNATTILSDCTLKHPSLNCSPLAIEICETRKHLWSMFLSERLYLCTRLCIYIVDTYTVKEFLYIEVP